MFLRVLFSLFKVRCDLRIGNFLILYLRRSVHHHDKTGGCYLDNYGRRRKAYSTAYNGIAISSPATTDDGCSLVRINQNAIPATICSVLVIASEAGYSIGGILHLPCSYQFIYGTSRIRTLFIITTTGQHHCHDSNKCYGYEIKILFHNRVSRGIGSPAIPITDGKCL